MKNGKYRETSKMSDLICENYPMVLVMSASVSTWGSERKTSGKYAGRIRSTHNTFLLSQTFCGTETIPTAEVQ